jgi:hypothetical protein
VLRAGLASRLLPIETGGVGSDSVGDGLRSSASRVSRKHGGTEHGSSSSGISSKASWSRFRDGGDSGPDILTR